MCTKYKCDTERHKDILSVNQMSVNKTYNQCAHKYTEIKIEQKSNVSKKEKSSPTREDANKLRGEGDDMTVHQDEFLHVRRTQMKRWNLTRLDGPFNSKVVEACRYTSAGS